MDAANILSRYFKENGAFGKAVDQGTIWNLVSNEKDKNKIKIL